MNLYALLQSRFPAARSAPCLLLPDGDDLNYGALEDGVGRLAALLLAKGVGVGDRVAAQTGKSPQGLMLYLASLQIGAGFLPLNPAYTPSEIAYFRQDAEPALFVTEAGDTARGGRGFNPPTLN